MKPSFPSLVGLILLAAHADAGEYPRWTHLSSKLGDLPAPGISTEQTACLVLDIDQDGLTDIVIASRELGAESFGTAATRPAGRSTRSIAGSTLRPAASPPISTEMAIWTWSSGRTTRARRSTGGKTRTLASPRMGSGCDAKSRAPAARCTTTRSSATSAVTGATSWLSGCRRPKSSCSRKSRAIPGQPRHGPPRHRRRGAG